MLIKKKVHLNPNAQNYATHKSRDSLQKAQGLQNMQNKTKKKNEYLLFYVQNNVPEIGTNILHAPKDECCGAKTQVQTKCRIELIE